VGNIPTREPSHQPSGTEGDANSSFQDPVTSWKALASAVCSDFPLLNMPAVVPARPLGCEAPGSMIWHWEIGVFPASVFVAATAAVLGDGSTEFRGVQRLAIGQLKLRKFDLRSRRAHVSCSEAEAGLRCCPQTAVRQHPRPVRRPRTAPAASIITRVNQTSCSCRNKSIPLA
jgi:hypothetical protein